MMHNETTVTGQTKLACEAIRRGGYTVPAIIVETKHGLGFFFSGDDWKVGDVSRHSDRTPFTVRAIVTPAMAQEDF